MTHTSRAVAVADRLYAAARPILFRLDPERAHHLGLRLLDLAAAVRSPLLPRVEDPVTVFGVRFANRVGLAAGLDKDGRHIDALAALGFGVVELGTVPPRPQPGNPKPRLFRLPAEHALINRFGFNNDGLEAFVARVRRARRGIPLGLNIGKNADTPIERAPEDYLRGLDAVHAHADYVTINISSPNTRNLRSLQSGDAFEALLRALAARRDALAVTHGRRVPLLVKIAPDLGDADLEALCDALPTLGVDGLIATNTTIDRTAVAHASDAHEAGGLSGAPLSDRSRQVLTKVRGLLPAGYPVISVGGIMDAPEARRRLDAGADLVQLYTGLVYAGPALVHACANALREGDKP